MRLISGIKQLVYKADLFDSGSLLRVKGEPEHKTLLGGIISISVMALLIAAFYSKIIDTLDKVLITSSISTANANNPISFNISTLDNGPFMFGVEVWQFNLNEGSRYFDIVLLNTFYTFGEAKNSTKYMLEPCTKSHWQGYPSIQNSFDQLNISYWKCLPKNMKFEIKGKYSSEQMKSLSVSVSKCTNNTFESRPCAPQSQIDDFFRNYPTNFFTIYYLNPLINPDNQIYLQYYLQDVNYMIFSQDSGAEALLFIDDYTIQTDKSILPNSEIQIQAGGIITNTAIKNAIAPITNVYAIFYFYKSSKSNTITRSFQKLDEVFSYIGGLFGTILMFFFLISSYNTYKFEVNLAGYLYRTERDKTERVQKSYNFIYFIGQSFYSLLRLLTLRPNWKRLSEYYETREEMLKQLDILYLIKRVNFLERSLSLLFTPQQLKGLHLTSQLTMEDAVKIRKNYKLKSKMKKEMQGLEKSQFPQIIDFNGKQPTSNHNISSELIEFQNGDFPNFSAKKLATRTQSYNFDEDNYSSQDSSSEDQQQIIEQIGELRKDENNELSKRIWKGIDSRIKQMIDKYASKSKLNNLNKGERTINNMHISNALQISNFVLEEQSRNSIQEESRSQDDQNYANNMFPKIVAVTVKNQFQFNYQNRQQ